MYSNNYQKLYDIKKSIDSILEETNENNLLKKYQTIKDKEVLLFIILIN